MNQYFYVDASGKQKGTYSPYELRQENLRRDTLVWTEGMEQWKRAEEVEELKFLFEEVNSVPPIPEPTVLDNQSQQIQPMPKSWLLESILVTVLPFLFCGSFLSLLGIIAIVYAAQVESLYNNGDVTAAKEASRSAGRWTKISLWIFIAWVVILIATLFIIFGALGYGLSGMSDLLDA